MKHTFRFWICGIAVSVVGLISTARVEAQQSLSPAEAKPTDSAPKDAADPLAQQVAKAIDISSRRYLQANAHTPWQIMHGVLALRGDFRIKHNGQKVRAIDWIAGGATHRFEPWFEVTQYGGRAHPYSQPYVFEGHPNQFLAILSGCDLPMDFKLKAGNQTITIADLVKNAQMEVNDREEITWTLWTLSHYLGPDASWRNKWGEPWSVERLVQIQTYESVYDAACGGTHGLFALSYARNVYEKTGRPLRGVWLEADQKIQRYVESARSLQNSDGTFSSSYFEGRDYSYDFNTQCATSGHMLEFLMMALPEQRLNEQWVRRGVAAVAQGLIDHRSEPIECGPLYHALSGLVIYRNRTQPKTKPPEKTDVAEAEQSDEGSDQRPEVDDQSVKADIQKKLAAAEMLRAEAEAKRAEADAKRAVAEAKRVEMEQAEDEAKRAEAEAARAEAEAARAEAEAQRVQAFSRINSAAPGEPNAVNN